MQCERAQEFFSDYLERTLDRPMTVALEAHLGGCAGCREEIEALQSVFQALEAAPLVEPPADGMWQVKARLANLRAEEHEARRRKSGTLLDWLRGLNPLSAAMGAGLATLVIGGGLFMARPQLPGHVEERIVPIGGPSIRPAALPAHASVSAIPTLGISYGPVSAEGTQVNLQVTPPVELRDAVVTATVSSVNRNYSISGPSGPQRPLAGSLTLPVGSPAEVLRVTVASPSLKQEWSYVVLAPLGQREETSITQAFFDQPVDEALRRLGPALNAPVVVDNPSGTVSLQVSEASPRSALQSVADQLHASLRQEDGVYHLTPNP